MARQAEGMERRDAAEYGRFYFHIRQSDKEHSDVYCYADRVEVTPSGALSCDTTIRTRGRSTPT
jgi:hypothetical protein